MMDGAEPAADRRSTGARRVIAVVEVISAGALTALLALVCTSVILRYAFNMPIPDTFDLSRMFLGVAVFWGIAAACARDDHIRGDLLHSVLKPPVKNVVNVFAQLCVLAFIGLLTWQLWEKTWDVARTNQETAELRLKIWPFYLAAWTATALTIGGVVMQLFRAAQGLEGDVLEPAADPSPDGEGEPEGRV